MYSLEWFPYSLMAAALLGISMAFYKLPSAKGASRFSSAFWSLSSSSVLAVIFFASYLHLTSTAMLLMAALWGASFLALILLQMYALGAMDTNVLFPVTTTASLVLSVLFGLFIFNEQLTVLQMAGIIIAVATVFSFLYKGGKLEYRGIILFTGATIIFISAFNKILQKVISDNFDIHAFQIFQYLFGALFALALFFIFHRGAWREHITTGIVPGIAMGVFGFLGGYAFLIALTKGPFSLIVSIHSFYIFVTALVAYFLFREELTKKKLFLLALAVLAILLIRLG